MAKDERNPFRLCATKIVISLLSTSAQVHVRDRRRKIFLFALEWIDSTVWSETELFCGKSNMWMCIGKTWWLWTFLMAFGRMSDMIDCSDYSPYFTVAFSMTNNSINWARLNAAKHQHYPSALENATAQTSECAMNLSSSNHVPDNNSNSKRTKQMMAKIQYFLCCCYCCISPVHNFVIWKETWIYFCT